jgi:hypothetical protein
MPKTVNELGQIIIEESNLKFGYYSVENLFHIEESKIYKQLQPDGVKTVEFALFKKGKILLFEVKKTAPQLLKSDLKLEKFIENELSINQKKIDFDLYNEIRHKSQLKLSDTLALIMSVYIDNSELLNRLYKKIKHDDYFDEVLFKFNDSLALLSAIYLNRHDKAKQELPENFKNLDLSTLQFVLVLVVKNHPTESLVDLTTKLNKKLKPLIQIWKPTSVAVLNEALAKKRGYVVES